MNVSPPPPRVGPAEILPYAAARHPDATALVADGRRFTYRELAALSGAVAASLQHRGIGTGDVVSLYGQNGWEWIVGYHGALRAGAVVNPVNVMLTGPELAYVLNDCQAKVIIAGSAQTAVAADAARRASSVQLRVSIAGDAPKDWLTFDGLTAEGRRHPLSEAMPEPTDLCSIAYTSGTTGHPKGAMQSQQSILLNCAYTATMHGRLRDDVVVTALPAAHVYGNVAINSTFLAGGAVVLMQRFDPAGALGLIETERATMFEGVPAMYSMMLAHDEIHTTDFTSLRKSTVGGQTFSPEVARRWEEIAGVPLLELWGMTEISGLGTTHSVFAPSRSGSIGVSLPGTEVQVRAFDGERRADVGEPGELMVRGPLVMLGYFGRPEETAEVLDSDGWLHTGDVATTDGGGHLYVVDRLKDMLVTGGYNVYPAEIERVVAEHPDVAMVAVGRRSDPIKGEIAVAFVVPMTGSHPDEHGILEYCRARLAAYKRPRAVVFVDQLPATSSGKLMRRKLVELDLAEKRS